MAKMRYTFTTSAPVNQVDRPPLVTKAAVMVAKRVCDFAEFTYKGYDGAMSINEDKIAKWSTMNATALVSQYAAKVEGKAEGMTDVEVSAMAADGSFTVTGTKAGQAIEIRQQMVIKINQKGTRFAQFPALVYIAGRKSTEKALKAL